MRLFFTAMIVTGFISATCLARAEPSAGLFGVNLSGAEFNPGVNKRLHFDYTYPNEGEIDYFAGKGFTTIRLPFDATRLYPKAYGALAAGELAEIKSVVTHAATKHMRVVLDPHNYGWIFDDRISKSRLIGRDEEGTRLFADFWGKTAEAFKATRTIVFGLMNEPNQQTPLEWRTGALPAIDAIRASGAKQTILIPGTSYTGAHSWTARSGNGEVWAGFHGDPEGNFAFEMHQYLDANSSGTSPQCFPGSGASRLRDATAWLERNHAKGFLGEFGWSDDPSCLSERAAMAHFLRGNRKTWVGWTWWAAGPWWPPSYPFSLEPRSVTENGVKRLQDREQLAKLQAVIRDGQ